MIMNFAYFLSVFWSFSTLLSINIHLSNVKHKMIKPDIVKRNNIMFCLSYNKAFIK